MADPIVIVSLAPWARRGLWWKQATLALRSDLLERPQALLMRYFLAGRDDCGAVSVNEATLLRGWAATVAGWEERAANGQFPLRFAGYSVDEARRLS
jgi:hypothetical protein